MFCMVVERQQNEYHCRWVYPVEFGDVQTASRSPRTGMLMLSNVAFLRNDAGNFVRSAPEMVVHVFCAVAGWFVP